MLRIVAILLVITMVAGLSYGYAVSTVARVLSAIFIGLLVVTLVSSRRGLSKR